MLIPLLRRFLRPSLLAALLFGGPAGFAHAQAPASTLERIKETGVLRVGAMGKAPPFSYLDAGGRYVGYSIDICKRLGEALRKQFGLPRLEIEYSPVTANTRVARINDGTADIECGTSTNTAQRRTVVAFAPTHFIAATRYVSLVRNNLHTVDDLRGKSVGIVSGTSNIAEIAGLNREKRLNLSLVATPNQYEAFGLVTQNKVAAFVMDDTLLYALVANSAHPEIYSVSDDAVGEPQPYGFMMRLDDTDFQRAVDAILRKLYAGPEMQALYDRWFNQPLPGGNVDLHLPMSPALRAAFGKGQ